MTNDDNHDNADISRCRWSEENIVFTSHHQGDKIIRNSILNGVDEFNSNRFTQTLPVMLWDLFPQPKDPPSALTHLLPSC